MSILSAVPQPTIKSLSAVALENVSLARTFGFPKVQSNAEPTVKASGLTAVVSKVKT